MVMPFVSRGYIVVAQERQGVGASFGVQKGFVTREDAKDGAAIVDWAGEQPWSTGKVGAIGCSNQDAYQLPVVAEHPKHLVAVATECASPFFWDTMISVNGVSAFAGAANPAYTGAYEQKVTLGEPVDEDNVPGMPAKAASNASALREVVGRRCCSGPLWAASWCASLSMPTWPCAPPTVAWPR